MNLSDPDQNATLEYYVEENELITAEKITGKLILKHQLRRNIDTQFRTCVSDGPNTVCSMCRFIHIYFTQESLHEAVTVFLPKLSLDDFWDLPTFTRFRQSLASLDTWEEQGIFIVGAQRVADGIEVSLVVEDRGLVVKSWRVEDLLRSGIKQIERLSLMKIEIVRDESCSKEPCPYYQKCRQTLKHMSGAEVYQTDNFVARTLKTLKTFLCECPVGFASSMDLPGQCDLRVDQCYNNPCRNNATCHPLENGYRCECQPGWRGDDCMTALNSLTCIPGYCKGNSICELVEQRMICKHCKYDMADSDDRCRLRSLGFVGKGLVNINKALSRVEWQLSFRIATIARTGIILFSGDRSSDFIEISVQDRILQAELSLGDNSKMVRMGNVRRNRINDGEWHTISITYYDRLLTLLLDDCDAFVALHAHGETPCATQLRIDLPSKCVDLSVPCFRFLDVYNGISLGGRPLPSGTVYQGFSGCIANITLNNELIEFSSLSAMDVRGTVNDGCSFKKDFCAKGFCPPKAKCVNRWNGTTCHCSNTVHRKGNCNIVFIEMLDARSEVVELVARQRMSKKTVSVKVLYRNSDCQKTLKKTDKVEGTGKRHENCKSRKDYNEELSSPHNQPLTLTEDDSYVIYRPDEIVVPFTLSFEFRTFRNDIQIIAAEFKHQTVFFKMEIDDGLPRVSLGQSSALIDAPETYPGRWTNVVVEFGENEVKTTIDEIYSLIDDGLPRVSLGQSSALIDAPETHPGRWTNVVVEFGENEVKTTIDEIYSLVRYNN
ncbi:laminin G domain protein [Dictyocaulus viviparus]|uniref:Laminin G domain protein n=1 Tax=Dictyocaulus viviparus TaxID=29172 RepID=A0A0D8Y040_DICVI|nr:laminin G domain protein [Dictyocaulus viviparus]